jgi:hypothetical protein
MLNENINFCTALPRVLCEERDGSNHLLFSSVFLLLEIERKRKKERTACGGEGENR